MRFFIFVAWFFVVENCNAQSALSKWSWYFSDSMKVYEQKFQVLPLDTSSQNGLTWKLNFSPSHPAVFVLLSVSGAILCFSDSLKQRPFTIEKNRYFPFRKWRIGEFYSLAVCQDTGPHGFIRCTWKRLPHGEILDEIFLCYPAPFSEILPDKLKADSGISIKKMP